MAPALGQERDRARPRPCRFRAAPEPIEERVVMEREASEKLYSEAAHILASLGVITPLSLVCDAL